MSPFMTQQQAADPQISCWIEASAGSGKTKVLVDRLVNLLLQGVQADQILCLTFTRAAAAEMSHRLNKRLRELTLMNDGDVHQIVTSLTFTCLKDPRQLFLEVLETPPKIQTLHSFCQMLLLQFSLEAGISPHFRLLEEPENTLLLNQTIDRVFEQVKPSLAYWGELRLRNMILQGLGNSEILASLEVPFEKEWGSLLGLPPFWEDSGAEKKLQDAFMREHKCEDVESYCAIYLTQKGEIRKANYKSPQLLEVASRVKDYRDQCVALTCARKSLQLLTLLRQVSQAYQRQKQDLQAFDFSDLITLSLRLLKYSSQSAWVLYRVAASIRHVLIDEAQDTSHTQWELIQTLVHDLMGEGTRTLFTVGDPKQSIYSFQGANPHHFLALRSHFQELVLHHGGDWRTYTLDVSFRSAPQILDGVDQYFQHYAHGVDFYNIEISHKAFRETASGKLTFWPLVEAEDAEAPDPWALPGHEEAQTLPQWQAADQVATSIESLLTEGQVLSATGKPIVPEDILVLVRRRSAFIDCLVQGLKKRDIPVSGADRMVLTEHLAIQDLLAFGNFLLLPEDDFNLACLLKSSLIGCSEEELWELCYQRQESLWHRLQQESHWVLPWLQQWRDRASLSPYELYSDLLGKGGRANILKRLGNDADDVIDGFLNVILDYENDEGPSLQGLLSFLHHNPPHLQRSSIVGNVLRVMTIHGAKGLEAPVVILVDSPDIVTATINPFLVYHGRGSQGFLARPASDQDCPFTTTLKADQDKGEKEEQNRLLYVAMTRAKDHLYVTGWENKRGKALWYRSLVSVLGGEIQENSVSKRYHVSARAPLPSWILQVDERQ